MIVMVASSGAVLGSVHVLAEGDANTSTTAPASEPPNPILPVGPEILWSLGMFLLLVVLMRYWLYPRLQRGTDAREQLIREGTEGAEQVRAGTRTLQADYEAGILDARAEATRLTDAARADVEADRRTKLEAANAQIAALRAEAAEADAAARRAALGGVEGPVADVAADIAGRALGRPVPADAVRPYAAELVQGAAR